MQELYRQIYRDPEFHELESRRTRFSWTLAGIIFILYFSFILVIAFSPELFSIPLSDSTVITWGLPYGLFVIISSFVLTGVYVLKANNEFDHLGKKLVDKVLIHTEDKNS